MNRSGEGGSRRVDAFEARRTVRQAPVAQLDRASVFETEGCRFESCRARCGGGMAGLGRRIRGSYPRRSTCFAAGPDAIFLQRGPSSGRMGLRGRPRLPFGHRSPGDDGVSGNLSGHRGWPCISVSLHDCASPGDPISAPFRVASHRFVVIPCRVPVSPVSSSHFVDACVGCMHSSEADVVYRHDGAALVA